MACLGPLFVLASGGGFAVCSGRFRSGAARDDLAVFRQTWRVVGAVAERRPQNPYADFRAQLRGRRLGAAPATDFVL